MARVVPSALDARFLPYRVPCRPEGRDWSIGIRRPSRTPRKNEPLRQLCLSQISSAAECGRPMQVADGIHAVFEPIRSWWSCSSPDIRDPRRLLWGNSASDAGNGTHCERGPTIHAAVAVLRRRAVRTDFAQGTSRPRSFPSTPAPNIGPQVRPRTAEKWRRDWANALRPLFRIRLLGTTRGSRTRVVRIIGG